MMMAQAFPIDLLASFGIEDDPLLTGHEISLILSPAEHAVAAQLITGAQNKEIAFALDCAEATIKFHMRSLNRILGMTCRLQCALVLLGIKPPRAGAVMVSIAAAEKKAKRAFFDFAVIPRNIRIRYDRGEPLDLSPYVGPEWSESRAQYARWKALEAMRDKFSAKKAAA